LTDTPENDPLWYEIVWGQFKKRTIAWYSMWGVVGLFLVAVFAPLFISNKPFIWKTETELLFPWWASLYDRNFFENAIDIFFNTLLFPGVLFAIPAILAWRKAASLPRAQREHARFRAAGVASGLWLVIFLGILLVPHQDPKRVFPDEQKALVEAGQEVLAIYPPLPFSFRDGNIYEDSQDPSFKHPLGTDSAGCDVLARLVFGTRISLTVGLFAVALYCTFGTFLGAIAGFFGGRVDNLIMRAVEVVICIPSMFLVLTVASFIQQRSIFHIMLIIAAVAWTGPARLVRAEFLKLRELDFVAAARAVGFSRTTIIFQEILPNALGPVLVSATFGVASAILTESTMSFLGLGDITVPSWGQILATGRQTGSWVLILAPGFSIFLTVSLLNLMGEGARDALDPKLRR
jgi:peptide/nickel transport system permease protein